MYGIHSFSFNSGKGHFEEFGADHLNVLLNIIIKNSVSLNLVFPEVLKSNQKFLSTFLYCRSTCIRVILSLACEISTIFGEYLKNISSL